MADEPSNSQYAIGSNIAQAGPGATATVNVILPPQHVPDQNRVHVLGRLRVFYERQREDSLHGLAAIKLGLTKKPDAVLEHATILHLPDKKAERRLQAGTSILQVYDDSKQELLILGDPGTGKSALLLELACQLLTRAEQDSSHPLPVVLNLSSWTERQALQDWIVAQFSALYDVSLEVSKGWAKKNLLLPLLDGLDEVPHGTYAACMNAIAQYHKSYMVPLVVSSRSAEYEKMKREQRLRLNGAVLVELLSKEEVEDYLQQAGPSLATVRKALHTNPVLYELMQTPLMLSVMALTYVDAQAQDVPQQGSAEEQQRQIFAAYFQRMMGRCKSWRADQVLWWLCSLARMMRNEQSILLVERMQPEWLRPKAILLYRVMVGLVYAMSLSCAAVCVTLLMGMVYSRFDLLTLPIFGLVGAAFWVVGFGMGVALGAQRGIRPAEYIVWSWTNAGVGFAFGCNLIPDWIIFPLFLYTFMVVQSAGYKGLVYLAILLIPGLTSAFFAGLSKKQVSEKLPLAPNGGTWRSLRNGLRYGPIYGLIIGCYLLALCWFVGASLSPKLTLVCIGLIGLAFSLMGMFMAGLEAFVKHFALRFVLWCSRRLPFVLVPFLEEMAHCILLHKVGRGYAFPHRLLLEYFADLPVSPPAKAQSTSSIPDTR